MRLIVSLGFCTSLLAACGGGDDDDVAAAATVSCRVESAGNAVQCLEYTVPPEGITATRDGCTVGGGMLVASCPKEDRIGTCTMRLTGGVTLVTHYYSGGITPDTAQRLCADGAGTFTPN